MKKSRFTDAQILAILKSGRERRGGCGAWPQARDQPADAFMDGSPGASDLIGIPATLGANIYPASPGMLARPNG